MKQALELALEALIWTTGSGDFGEGGYAHEGAKKCLFPAITAIKEALAQPEQEPVAYLSNKRQRLNIELKPQTFVEIPTVTDWEMPLYMKPPQRPWVGLTQEELCEIVGVSTSDSDWNVAKVQEWLRKVEAKLKDKNT